MMSKTTGLEIAVIGMACRFPGANNIKEFWRNLKSGTESITFFSKEELLKAGVKEEVLNNDNYVRAKGTVDNYNHFDAEFFGYSKREAEVMDPQIRMFHEVAWESLEDAGYNPESYDQPIGLFGAASANLYWQASSMLLRNNSASEQFSAIQLTDKDFMNTKISYKLNLTGPSVAVDTACSSSLTAVHLASRSLLTGDCKMALAGGVTVYSPHKKGYMYQEGMIMSPDGHCRAFDAEARGTVGGEGCGVVVLKTLKQAIKDRDHIYAVIKGSAYNNDGSRKVGYTAPSIDGQAEVIKKALKISKVEPESISYIEAHGTGTSLGDPVEIEALKQAFNTNKYQYCGIGSVKTNIGHLDSAAGIAGFIKVALTLYKKTLIPSLHYRKPNPKIDFENSPFYVNTTVKKWTKENVFRAGVSSFGIGGTNVHVVMEEPPLQSRDFKESKMDQLMVLSARSEETVEKSVERLKYFIAENQHIPLKDMAYTLQVGRKHFPYRQTFTIGQHGMTGHELKPYRCLQQPAVIFMFSGQGSQYVNMGKDLYDKEPVFKMEIERCFSIVEEIEGVHFKKILYPENAQDTATAEKLIHQTVYTQIILFSFEYALASLLISRGIKPHYMIGHSLGELTAACLSGVFTLEDALKSVITRGNLMQTMPEGDMVSVAMSAKNVEKELIEGIELSAVNSSDLSVVSGSTEKMKTFALGLEKKGITVQYLKTSHAFHSSMMQTASIHFARMLKGMHFREPSIPFLSNVTGTWIENEEVMDSEYWASQIRSKVEFDAGLQTLFNMGEAIFVEVGPGNALCQFVRKHKKYSKNHAAVNLIRHPKEIGEDYAYLLNGIGKLWKLGVSINWGEFQGSEQYKRVSLPTYPFEHQRFPEPHEFSENMEGRLKGQIISIDKQQPPFDEWFYIPVWERIEPAIKSIRHQGKKVIVFEETERLSEYLKNQGAEVVTVKVGKNFLEIGKNVFEADHHQTPHLQLLMSKLKEKDFVPDDVVCMWKPVEGDEMADLEKTLSGYLPILDIVRLIGADSTKKVNLTVITNKGHDVTGTEHLQPHQAAIAGVCLTIPQEYKNIKCKNIDLCLEEKEYDTEEWPSFISYELVKDDSQAVVAYRGKSRWIRGTKKVSKSNNISTSSMLKKKGVYIITGGLGGIGLTLAAYLAKHVQARLVLISRTSVPKRELWHEESIRETIQARKIKKLLELEKLGAELLVIEADISEEDMLQKAIARTIERFGGEINGIIHAAGIADGKMIHTRSIEDEKKILRAKLKGTLLLRKILKDKKIDFFLLCSSLVSFLGAGGQVAYAAANAFLDSYAHAAMREGKNVITVNWDRWDKVGMSFEWETAGLLSRSLKERESENNGMQPAEGAQAFIEVLQLGYPQVLVSLSDLNTRIENRLYQTVEKQQDATVTKNDLGSLEEKLTNIFKDFFHSQQTDINENFFELGASSLDLLQVSGIIKSELGLEVPVVMMYSHPSIASLANAIKSQHGNNEHENVKKIDRQQAINEGKNRRKQRLIRK
ncbi:SDR family NAD(P)-dependent oxidoreductase [Bacillus pseudomycoides]|uniref:SDR family NAD(P)-dependent oxidoreductase n=2 Tax=Bacillus bingmayongensis TaxID=1150157 RepID=A0ABU5K117_9BACI|nr:SDR family NAD(P)-dependent oxidoreductase [Bacillus pseudomycoides]